MFVPQFTDVMPDGVTEPFGPELAVILYVIGLKVAEIVCDSITLVKLYVVIGPCEIPSTKTSAITEQEFDGAITYD